jgi:hypothetical protein
MHSLRKGFGCYYAGKVPAQVLQKLMRHHSIRTTMDYYANVDQAAVDAVLKRNSSRNSTRPREGKLGRLIPQVLLRMGLQPSRNTGGRSAYRPGGTCAQS